MDKQTFGSYGSLVAVVIIIAIMISFATPFAQLITVGGTNFLDGFGSIADKALGNLPSGGNNGGGAGVALDAPQNLRLEGNVLTFDLVANADEYLLSVNGSASVAYTTNTIDVSTYLATLEAPVEFAVVASDADGEYTNSAPTVYTHNEVELEAGLYDAEGNLLASWDTLVKTYGLDVESDYGFRPNDDNFYETSITTMYYIFTNNENLAAGVKLVIDDSVTTIGNYAFKNCSFLKEVEIPTTVTAIGADAFALCMSLTSVEIPESVDSIGSGAFASCSSLASVTIPSAVTYLDNITFADCTSLETVVFEGTVEQWKAVYKEAQCFDNVPATYVQCSGRIYCLRGCSFENEVTTEATCTTPGVMTYTCSKCGEIYTEEITPAHSYVDGSCTVCGVTASTCVGTWIFHSGPVSSACPSASITFTTNNDLVNTDDGTNYGNSFERMFTPYSTALYFTRGDGESSAYAISPYDGFINGFDGVIHITGGEDATNDAFIAWLQANATKQ